MTNEDFGLRNRRTENSKDWAFPIANPQSAIGSLEGGGKKAEPAGNELLVGGSKRADWSLEEKGV
jgi:hypothetical protein